MFLFLLCFYPLQYACGVSSPYFANNYDEPSDMSEDVLPVETKNTNSKFDKAENMIEKAGNGIANQLGKIMKPSSDIIAENSYEINDENIDINFENQNIFESEIEEMGNKQNNLVPGQKFLNVQLFDIQGISLGESFEDVKTAFFDNKNLYSPVNKNAIIYSIPNTWKVNLDYECRQTGLNIQSQIDTCIQTSAQKQGLLYPAEIQLERLKTGEKISVFFTSNITGNVVWRIIYHNDVDELEGNGETFELQRDKKIMTFWQSVLDKYGQPNSGETEWVSSTNSYDPKMTAAYGELVLENLGLYEKDKSENEKDSLLRFQAKPYSF